MPNHKNKTQTIGTSMIGEVIGEVRDPAKMVHSLLSDKLIDSILVSVIVGGTLTSMYNQGGITSLTDMLSGIIGGGSLVGISTVVAHKAKGLTSPDAGSGNTYLVKFVTSGLVNALLHVAVYDRSLVTMSPLNFVAHFLIGGLACAASSTLVGGY